MTQNDCQIIFSAKSMALGFKLASWQKNKQTITQQNQSTFSEMTRVNTQTYCIKQE